MDVTAIEYGATIEAVDPLLAQAIEWANERPADRLDPQWFYSFADMCRAIEAYREGQP